MPYITAQRRIELADGQEPDTAGELNYLLTVMIRDYFRTHANYQGINDIVGALEGAKLEFTRRITNSYEDGKIKTNGDVY